MNSPFLERAVHAINDAELQELLDRNASARKVRREEAFRQLPDALDLRKRAKRIRQETIRDLNRYLAAFSNRLERNGFHVHRASNAAEAIRIVVEIARGHEATLIAKSKSMVTEEIKLNPALEAAGIEVVETDLGERIVQLRGEAPSHIVTPSLHLTKEQVADTFSEHLGEPVYPDVYEINRAARAQLRKSFFEADVGVSGVNFGVVETGSLCMVTNEGNGRMVTSLPPVHIAVMGVERLVPSMDDLAVMLRLLARSATGQKLTNYVSLITSPRRGTDPDGSEERHVVLVDNGRVGVLQTPLAEALECIRCGACLNACPVFREVGGHAYDSVYPGPIGSVVSPALFGFGKYSHLAKASTLCGACVEACPVGIDIPSMLLRVRATAPSTDGSLRRGIKAFAWAAKSPTRFRLAQWLSARLLRYLPHRSGWITSLLGPLTAWTDSRDFPPFAARPLRTRLAGLNMNVEPRAPEIRPREVHVPVPPPDLHETVVDDFETELRDLGGEVVRCTEAEFVDRLVGQLYVLGASRILSWGQVEPILFTMIQRLQDEFTVTLPQLPRGVERPSTLRELDLADAGITGALAAFADTGTVLVSSASRRSLLPSLLPSAHIVIVRAKDIFPNMEAWLEVGGGDFVRNSANVVMISGPSRTADIELSLTIGVHGPAQVIAFVIE